MAAFVFLFLSVLCTLSLHTRRQCTVCLYSLRALSLPSFVVVCFVVRSFRGLLPHIKIHSPSGGGEWGFLCGLPCFVLVVVVPLSCLWSVFSRVVCCCSFLCCVPSVTSGSVVYLLQISPACCCLYSCNSWAVFSE